MTTTATEIATALILALDLGKYKSVACVYRSADDARSVSIATSREEPSRLLDEHRPRVVLPARRAAA